MASHLVIDVLVEIRQNMFGFGQEGKSIRSPADFFDCSAQFQAEMISQTFF